MGPAAFVQLGSIGLHPAPNASGINGDATLRQKFGDVFVGQGISQVPPNAEQDHLAGKVAPFEGVGRGDGHELPPYQTGSPFSQRNPPAEYTSLKLDIQT